MKKSIPYGDGGDAERTKREISTLQSGRHDNVVRLFGAFSTLSGLLKYCLSILVSILIANRGNVCGVGVLLAWRDEIRIENIAQRRTSKTMIAIV